MREFGTEHPFDPAIARYYTWQYNHYQMRPDAVQAFWASFNRWAATPSGRRWLESARQANAVYATIRRWHRQRITPHRLHFVRACELFGWSLVDFFPSQAGRAQSVALRRLFPYCGKSGAERGRLVPDAADEFFTALARLVAAPLTPAGEAATRLRLVYEWLGRAQRQPGVNLAPDAVCAFAAAIGRKPEALLRLPGQRMSKAARQSPKRGRHEMRPGDAALSGQRHFTSAKRCPNADGWSFFGGCA